jgi:single-strand DNA-binding protein
MNQVNMIGRLTRDPELVETKGGTAICKLRVAVDRRNRDDGAVFVDVKAFEGQARACADHLSKGRQVAITGRLELDEWEAKDGSGKRSRVYVIGERIQFLGRSSRNGDQGEQEPSSEEPAGVAGAAGDEDIPF